jgi:hypothetical protein
MRELLPSSQPSPPDMRLVDGKRIDQLGREFLDRG